MWPKHFQRYIHILNTVVFFFFLSFWFTHHTSDSGSLFNQSPPLHFFTSSRLHFTGSCSDKSHTFNFGLVDIDLLCLSDHPHHHWVQFHKRSVFEVCVCVCVCVRAAWSGLFSQLSGGKAWSHVTFCFSSCASVWTTHCLCPETRRIDPNPTKPFQIIDCDAGHQICLVTP